VLINDHFELLQRLESNTVAKWAANVKNVQSSGIGNISMIADDLHKPIGKKFLVVERDF